MTVHLDDKPWWQRRTLWLAGAVVLVGMVVVGLWSGPGDADPSVNGGLGGNASASKPSGPGFTSAPAPGAGAPLVEVDMLGTRMDVSRLFQLGFGGGLNLDSETRATLDTLLVQMPDPPAPQDLEKLEYTLRQGLPKEEAERALKLFQGYRGYQSQMRAEGAQLGIPETAQGVDEYFAQVARIQRRHFDDATAAALFGQETRNARAVMMAAVIDQNQNLSPAQKKEQIDALRNELPPDQRGVVPEPSAGAASEAK